MQDTHGNSLTVAYRGVGGMSDVADNTCTHYQGDPPICTSEIGNVQQWYAVSSYPYKIRYSQNDTGGARRIVRFILSQRSDVPSGVQTWETHKLNAVEMRLSPFFRATSVGNDRAEAKPAGVIGSQLERQTMTW